MRRRLPWFSTITGFTMARSRTALAATAVAVLATGSLAACGSSSSGGSGGSSKGPITIGASLSLTGDFSADGQSFKQGYEMWAADVNAQGGLLGRKVKLTILNDASNPDQAVTNYQTLINTDHVDLTFGPYSSLITTPAEAVAARAGYAFPEGAGGAPTVFNTPANQAAHNIFDVALPIKNELVPFLNWIKSLPAAQRPKTAAYPMVDSPFTVPPVQLAQKELQALGVRTVYSKIFPEEVADYKAPADQVASKAPDLVVLGSSDVPTVAAFMQAFEQQHYTPKMFIAAAGPDQGAEFTKAVGAGNANGIMVPNAWYPGYENPQSKNLVKEYVAKYGGSASEMSGDVAEGYAVGQVTADAVKATGGLDNSKIISYLHGAASLSTVMGPTKFDSLGENTQATAFVFQWQKGDFNQVLPAGVAGSKPIIATKPAWSS